MGRFVIWSDAAFQALDGIFGTYNEKGQEKGGYQLQRPMMAQQDSRALIQSDSIQSVLRPMRDSEVSYGKKKNPFKNPQLMEKLNPFFKAKRRYDLLKVKNAKGQ